MSSSPSAPSPVNHALQPLPDAERTFGWRNHASLWFSLGVGLLVMQVGSFLMPALGLSEALLAIVGGSVIGAGLLAWTARIGCDSGLTSAGLMHATYGSAFARLPIVLNIVQLIGWTTFELVVMRDSSLAIGRQAGWLAADGWTIALTVFWGAVVVMLLSGSMTRLVRRLISRAVLPLVVLSLLWLSWHFFDRAQQIGLSALWHRPGQGGMGVLPALDLVIAMPVSWLPLVADFARHGRRAGDALTGTWTGYAIANIWCYLLGVMVALTLPSADLVSALLLAQGGLIALSLLLVDEVDNAYGDAYSGSVSAHSLQPRWSIRRWGITLAIACTVLALFLPMHSLEPFLLTLSSVFVPLYGVILGRLGLGGDVRRRLARSPRVDPSAVAIWVAGIALYHLAPQWAPDWGAALPTLAATFVLASLIRSPAGRAGTIAA
ncbi:MAG: cytosine permease [Burkholderiaceae bacterium]